jgi:hypothetical protein
MNRLINSHRITQDFKISEMIKVKVFHTTFNNISVISWRSVLLVEETGSTLRKQQTCRKSLTNLITQCCIEYTSPWAGFKLTTLVVIGTDCTCSLPYDYDHDCPLTYLRVNLIIGSAYLSLTYVTSFYYSLKSTFYFHVSELH